MRENFKVRDLRRKEKFFIDDVYLNGWAKKLRPSATAVYISLCRHADKEQTCFPSIELIAEQHAISRKTVQRAINKLKDFNIIKTEQKRSKTGKWKQNIYYLLDRSEWFDTVGQKRPTANRGSKMTVTEGQKRPPTEGQIRPNKVSQYKDTQLRKYASIKDIGEAEIQQISEDYQVPISLVRSSYEDLVNYCQAHGRRYKNYLAALRNFVKKDNKLNGIKKKPKPENNNMPEITPLERAKAHKKLDEIRGKLKGKLSI